MEIPGHTVYIDYSSQLSKALVLWMLISISRNLYFQTKPESEIQWSSGPVFSWQLEDPSTSTRKAVLPRTPKQSRVLAAGSSTASVRYLTLTSFSPVVLTSCQFLWASLENSCGFCFCLILQTDLKRETKRRRHHRWSGTHIARSRLRRVTRGSREISFGNFPTGY